MIAFLFAVLALLGTFWVIEDKDTRYGLWQKCEITNGTQVELNDDDPFNNEHMECSLFNKGKQQQKLQQDTQNERFELMR